MDIMLGNFIVEYILHFTTYSTSSSSKYRKFFSSKKPLSRRILFNRYLFGSCYTHFLYTINNIFEKMNCQFEYINFTNI